MIAELKQFTAYYSFITDRLQDSEISQLELAGISETKKKLHEQYHSFIQDANLSISQFIDLVDT
jgi:hypothetical protein